MSFKAHLSRLYTDTGILPQSLLDATELSELADSLQLHMGVFNRKNLGKIRKNLGRNTAQRR